MKRLLLLAAVASAAGLNAYTASASPEQPCLPVVCQCIRTPEVIICK